MCFELNYHSCNQENQHLQLFVWMADCQHYLIKKIHLFLKTLWTVEYGTRIFPCTDCLMYFKAVHSTYTGIYGPVVGSVVKCSKIKQKFSIYYISWNTSQYETLLRSPYTRIHEAHIWWYFLVRLLLQGAVTDSNDTD